MLIKIQSFKRPPPIRFEYTSKRFSLVLHIISTTTVDERRKMMRDGISRTILVSVNDSFFSMMFVGLHYTNHLKRSRKILESKHHITYVVRWENVLIIHSIQIPISSTLESMSCLVVVIEIFSNGFEEM